ncbi:hypothetical protein GUJ93_ZPchr0014g46956 [Zizania palustris]|uniref:Uncharacterized protein n=1 Tax=Zizania palustris TaxID=103762 RepID=A0A8J5W0V4_ZIZPA|nr:hypothetical protein GUJ93_ZPchr0014g46956 [Zizania palustris]
MSRGRQRLVAVARAGDDSGKQPGQETRVGRSGDWGRRRLGAMTGAADDSRRATRAVDDDQGWRTTTDNDSRRATRATDDDRAWRPEAMNGGKRRVEVVRAVTRGGQPSQMTTTEPSDWERWTAMNDTTDESG